MMRGVRGATAGGTGGGGYEGATGAFAEVRLRADCPLHRFPLTPKMSYVLQRWWQAHALAAPLHTIIRMIFVKGTERLLSNLHCCWACPPVSPVVAGFWELMNKASVSSVRVSNAFSGTKSWGKDALHLAPLPKIAWLLRHLAKRFLALGRASCGSRQKVLVCLCASME